MKSPPVRGFFYPNPPHAMNESLYKHCLIGKCVRRTAIIAALLLAACDKPDTTDLAALTIPGVAPYQYLDDPVISVSVSILTLSVDLPREDTAKTVLDGQQLAADEGVSNDAIAAAVDKALGDDWQRGKAERGTWDTWVMTWETRKKPKRYYAIAAWDHVITAADGRRYRPLESLYTRAP